MQQHCASSPCLTLPPLSVLNSLRLAGVETRFPFSKVFDGSATQEHVFDSLADLPDATVDGKKVSKRCCDGTFRVHLFLLRLLLCCLQLVTQ